MPYPEKSPISRPNEAAISGFALARPLVIPVTIPQNFSGRVQISVTFLLISKQQPTDANTAAESMPRSKGRKGPKIPASQTRQAGAPAAFSASSAPPVGIGYDPNGPMEQRSVVKSQDGWSEYELDDGTKIRTRVALVDVKRAVGQHNLANGDPIYLIQAASITNIDAPAHLKKK